MITLSKYKIDWICRYDTNINANEYWRYSIKEEFRTYHLGIYSYSENFRLAGANNLYYSVGMPAEIIDELIEKLSLIKLSAEVDKETETDKAKKIFDDHIHQYEKLSLFL